MSSHHNWQTALRAVAVTASGATHGGFAHTSYDTPESIYSQDLLMYPTIEPGRTDKRYLGYGDYYQLTNLYLQPAEPVDPPMDTTN